MTPLPATAALDAYFLEARARLLDLAAILDRIDRGADPAAALADPRTKKIRRALEVLLNPTADRAAAVQQLFSLEYEPDWKRPAPRQ
jgi:hypothetical protein